MDELVTMAREQLSLVMLGEGGSVDEEFMVVPTLVDEQVPAEQLDEFLLEANFEGLTGTILSPPTINGMHNFCKIAEDGGHQQDTATLHNLARCRPYEEFSNFSQHFHSEESNPFAFSPAVCANEYVSDDRSFDSDIGNSQDGGIDVSSEMCQDIELDVEPRDQRQFSELECPSSNWLMENTDLKFIEKMAVENEQQCQLLSDMLAQSEVFPEEQLVDDFDEYGNNEEASEILQELYREAQLLGIDTALGDNEEYRRMEASWTPVSTKPIVTSVQRDFSTAPKIPLKVAPPRTPLFHLADHDFGLAKRGRPPRKRNTAKREAVLKSKKRLQNREAALRYRLKKRSEKFEKESELEQVQNRNQYLKNEKYSLTAEVNYLKELLVEIKKLKGYQ